MKIEADSPDQYIGQLADDRKDAMTKLRQTILDNLPEGFEETMNYGMIGYVVFKSLPSESFQRKQFLESYYLDI